MTVVYIDELFMLNFIINLMLLYSTTVLIKYKCKWKRIIIGSAIGALYSSLMFFPSLKILYTLAFKVGFSMLIVLCVFGKKNIRRFFAALSAFFLLSFAVAGGITAICYSLFKNGFAYRNGIIYIDIPIWMLLLVAGLLCLTSQGVFGLFINRCQEGRGVCNVEISCLENRCVVNALIDTGNTLTDPQSGLPVIIVEAEKLKELSLEKMLAQNIRLIPYSTLGIKNGVLTAFIPDVVYIIKNSCRYKCCVAVGIYPNKLFQDGRYNALVPPGLINNINEEAA